MDYHLDAKRHICIPTRSVGTRTNGFFSASLCLSGKYLHRGEHEVRPYHALCTLHYAPFLGEFLHCGDVIRGAVEVEGEGAGEVFPDDAVYEELADFLVAGEHGLRAHEYFAFVRRHLSHEDFKGAAGARTVHPEVEEVERGDDEDFLQVAGFVLKFAEELFRLVEHLEHVGFREQDFHLRVGVEQLLEFVLVVPERDLDIRVAVGGALDEAGDAV